MSKDEIPLNKQSSDGKLNVAGPVYTKKGLIAAGIAPQVVDQIAASLPKTGEGTATSQKEERFFIVTTDQNKNQIVFSGRYSEDKGEIYLDRRVNPKTPTQPVDMDKGVVLPNVKIGDSAEPHPNRRYQPTIRQPQADMLQRAIEDKKDIALAPESVQGMHLAQHERPLDTPGMRGTRSASRGAAA